LAFGNNESKGRIVCISLSVLDTKALSEKILYFSKDKVGISKSGRTEVVKRL